MKLLKSHFWYNKSQRNGIFILVLIILVFQGIILFDVFSPKEKININSVKIAAFQKQIDSLKNIEIENRKPKIYPFNPNYITDYKGQQLGMSLDEIDRLLSFRKSNKFINSKKEFQEVTQISDSLLNTIAPYFKFPDWVTENNFQKSNHQVISSAVKKPRYKPLKFKLTTTDINKATTKDLQSINGIGPSFSERIIKYRSKLQGFSLKEQVYEVWGLEKEVADKVLKTFSIKEKPNIKKLNINTVTFKELLKNPYIDYELCKKIFNYRDEVAELQNLTELQHIKNFPLDKYHRIVLYLVAE